MDVEIGLFAVPPVRRDFDPERDVLFGTIRLLVTGSSGIELIVDQLPQFAGVDPYNRLIEQNGNDNVKAVVASALE